MTENVSRRQIRSFVIRGGRMTPSQLQAFEEHWKEQGLDISGGLINPEQLFNRKAPLVLEIGFGMGGSLVEMAESHPDYDFIGIEVHKPGVGAVLREVNQRDLKNLKVFWDDANIVIDQCLPEACLDRVQLFFPDPWHKKRHHKRRLVQAEFVQRLLPKLKQGGVFHMATDWEPYAEQMLEVMAQAHGYRNCSRSHGYSPRPEYRPTTKFEKRGEQLGHGVWDLLFEKTGE